MSASADIAVTAAFIWEGVTSNAETFAKAHAHSDSAIDMAREATQYATLLSLFCDAYFDQYEGDFPGVFDYEVSEEFGRWWVKTIAEEGFTSLEACTSQCLLLTKQFFTQMEIARINSIGDTMAGIENLWIAGNK